jgi:DNA polymerase-4
MSGSAIKSAPMSEDKQPVICRDCGQINHLAIDPPVKRCPACKSPRLLKHDELLTLGIAHLDCDAFYAAVEKRDNPDLHDKPVIIGGGRRGVVSTCCYIARIYGVHSAMPMFQALAACPDAVVVPPNMEKYAQVGGDVRQMMQDLTPLVEPVSIDEAFMDLRGTHQLHGGPPAQTLVNLVKRIEQEIGISVSIGLSHNKFLAKLASDIDKPKGFSIIGAAETLSFLADLPVGRLWGVGKAMQARLERDGIRYVSQLQNMDESDLARRYDSLGLRLARLARGQDARAITPRAPNKSISSETTFNEDLTDYATMEKHLWRLSERTAQRCKKQNIAGKTIVLKLKADRFSALTRNHALPNATQLADVIFETSRQMLQQVMKDKPGTSYRLIGVGVANLVTAEGADPLDLADPDQQKRKAAEQAMDKLRYKFGDDTIKKGRGL